MKRFIIALIIILSVTAGISAQAVSDTPSISIGSTSVTAYNTPKDSTLIVALYNKGRLADTKFYPGSGTIKGDFSTDMADKLNTADTLKAFLWNMKNITPLCAGASSLISELPTINTRTLVVYYTRSGNTETLANTVHSVSGGDIKRIYTVNAYPENYSECLAQVRQEQATDYRPPITVDLDDISQYDTILLGYPIWYSSIPTPVVTFLAKYDFSGKTIIPFCTSGSTGISGSLSRIRELCPNSTVKSGFRGTASTSETEVEKLLTQNGFSK